MDIVPVTAAIIFNAQGKVLLARRAHGDPQGSRWEFPGGKLQRGETPEECLRRELQEELGIEAEVQGVFHAVSQDLGDRSILLLAYLCKWKPGPIELREHRECRWICAKDLMNMDLLEADRLVAMKLAEKLGNGELGGLGDFHAQGTGNRT